MEKYLGGCRSIGELLEYLGCWSIWGILEDLGIRWSIKEDTGALGDIAGAFGVAVLGH